MVKVKNSKGKKKLSECIKTTSSPKKLNPFEIHINRQKHDVIGRKLKNDRGLPGVARAKALKKRKSTLLQEYKSKDKSNKFVDRRIGERNSVMSKEDRSIARFAAERAKNKKKSVFNLGDDEILTHKGQTLNEIEKFDDPRSDDDDDEGGKLEAEFVSDAHFGGGILRRREDSDQSRQDIINQLITESKKRKAEKQRENEQTIAMTEKLDEAWKDLQPMILSGKANKKSKSEDEEEEVKVKLDPYDKAFREMKFEAKGKPSDRLKSEEEVATDTRDRLAKLEEDRINRMRGIFDHETIKHRSADDLDDGFQLDTHEETLAYDDDGCMTLTVSEDQPPPPKEIVSEDESEGDSSSDTEENSEDDDLDDIKLYFSGDESDTDVKKAEEEVPPKVEQQNELKKEVDFTALRKSMEHARQQLPFTFQVPETYDKLQELLSGHNLTEQNVIFERMIKCNHPSLKDGNKQNLASLFAFLLQWLHDNAKEFDKTLPGSWDESSKEEEILKGFDPNFDLVATAVPHLYDLAQLAGAGNARQCVAAVLAEKSQECHKKKFPRMDFLIFLQIVPYVFPGSDFRHPVTTPALVVLAKTLSRSRVTKIEHLKKGLFLCKLIIKYTEQSERYLPECVRFYQLIVGIALKSLFTKEQFDNYCLQVGVQSSKIQDFKHTDSSDLKILIGWCLLQLEQICPFVKSSCVAWRSILCPIVEALKLADWNSYPSCVSSSVANLSEFCEERPKLEKLVAEQRRPKPLKMFEPLFERVTEGKRQQPMSEKKLESLKLKHRYKREMKGAVREIRRDRDFISKIRLKEAMKSDSERRDKVRQLMGSLATQAGEINKIERTKGNKKNKF